MSDIKSKLAEIEAEFDADYESYFGSYSGQTEDAVNCYRSAVSLIKEAITEIERLRSGWMPIETAPKDGSHVLLWRYNIQFVGYYGGANSGWRINAPGLPAMWPLPTHWMPLPQPPQEPK